MHDREAILYPAHDVPATHDGLPAKVQCVLGKLQDWIHKDIAASKLELGRPGDVCPYVRPGITRHQSIHFAPYFGKPLLFDAMVSFMRGLFQVFETMPPKEGAGIGFKAIIAVFAELDAASAPSLIDAVQIFLKREVILKGRMIGQFYPGCTEPGLHNPDFRPLESPYPLLVLRPMQLTDLQFLTAVPEFLQAYCNYFEIHSRDDLDLRLEKAGITKLPDLWTDSRRRAFGS